MQNDLIRFMQQYPQLIKRALITNNRIIAWSSAAADTVVARWRKHNTSPLRLVPISPLEGGLTQIRWNQVWDDAIEIQHGIRKAPNTN